MYLSLLIVIGFDPINFHLPKAKVASPQKWFILDPFHVFFVTTGAQNLKFPDSWAKEKPCVRLYKVRHHETQHYPGFMLKNYHWWWQLCLQLDPETKQQSSLWKILHSLGLKMVFLVRRATKSILVVFLWHSHFCIGICQTGSGWVQLQSSKASEGTLEA